MFDFVAKLRQPVKTENQPSSPLSFIKDRREILNALTKSHASGKLVGVYARALGEGMFLTGVNNIEKDGSEPVIAFETYDQSGQILGRTRLALGEIKMVCPFDAPYIHPLLSKVQQKYSA